ncbi:MAG: sugar phosphate nucleotidyltransferase, partial [Pseudomonadales bacterium]
MKAVILAGGFGTRISEETGVRPKPMVEIGDEPIIWHIMKMFSVHGINDFIICLGYKGFMIKEYFANYTLRRSDVMYDLGKNEMRIERNGTEDWKVTLLDTGQNSMTGGRLKRVAHYLDDAPFLMTYGDGVASIDIRALIDFHRQKNTPATVTA